MSDRCPSVVQRVSFPLTLLGVTRHVSSAHFNNMFAASSFFFFFLAPKGHNGCICQEPCQRLYLCQHFFSVSASQTKKAAPNGVDLDLGGLPLRLLMCVSLHRCLIIVESGTASEGKKKKTFLVDSERVKRRHNRVVNINCF